MCRQIWQTLDACVRCMNVMDSKSNGEPGQSIYCIEILILTRTTFQFRVRDPKYTGHSFTLFFHEITLSMSNPNRRTLAF